MHFYRLIDTSIADAVPKYHGTQADAHADAKVWPKHLWPDLRIELVDVPTDKGSIGKLLNNESLALIVQRTWKLTPRGGIVEVANGD